MKVTRRADYAIRLVAALMENEGVPFSVREAAIMQDVPYAFARSIQHELVQRGVLKSVRGAKGGMLLNVDPAEFTLYQLIEIVQGSISVAICANDPKWCERAGGCPFHKVWEGADLLLRDYLTSVTIKDLLTGKEAFITTLHAMAETQ